MRINLIALLLITSLFSCKDKEMTETNISKDTTVTGQISFNSPADAMKYVQPKEVVAYVFNIDKNDHDKTTATLDNEGNFKLQLKLNKPSLVTLVSDRQIRFILNPGDNTNIVVNKSSEPNQTTGITFSGDSATTNKILNEYFTTNPFKESRVYELQTTGSKQDLIAYLDSVRPLHLNHIEKYQNKNKGDENLVNFIEADKKYVLFNARLAFNSFVNERQLPEDELLDLNDLFENLPTVTPSDLLNSTETEQFMYYLSGALRAKAFDKLSPQATPKEQQQAYVASITAIKGNDFLKQLQLYSELVASFEDNNLEFYTNNKNAINSVFKDTSFSKKITSRYEETKNLLENPELSLDTQLLNFTSTDPSNFLKEIVANANGKVIYIDNWATWCGPCKEEFMNGSPELHEKFKKDVEFVYLCHSSKPETYKPIIAKYNIKGKHYFLNEQQTAVVAQQIKLEAFPTYVIINKKGEMVQSDYIHRPSNPNTTTILTGLINE